MTPQHRLRIDLNAAAYLDALLTEDADAQARLWARAATDPDLLAALREVHAGVLEENEAADRVAIGAVLARVAETHLPSAELVRPPARPVTVGDVANELFRHTPDRLPPEAHALNELLRASGEPLPQDLGLSKLTAWAEANFGRAAAEYWAAFRAAALKLELRQAATVEFALAARSTPKPEGSG
jgi:hypothetical protein